MGTSKTPMIASTYYWWQRCQKAERELGHMLEWAKEAIRTLDYYVADRDEMDDIARRLAEITGDDK